MSMNDEITSDVEAREQLRQVMRAVRVEVCRRYELANARIQAERRNVIFERMQALRAAK